MQYPSEFDVIVIGGGHAGTEAALAAARRGSHTLLLTHNLETLGQMSCNPSIGGIGKGHLVKEIDALGGAMAAAADEAGIQFRILNASKGPAVRATRAQADRVLYRQAIRSRLENQPNLWLFQQAVDDLILDGDRIKGVVTQLGVRFQARAVILTTGTFLGGLVHVGLQNYAGGTRRRPAGRHARCSIARAASAGRASEDRNATPSGWADDRFRSHAGPAGRLPDAGILFPGPCVPASAASALLDHPHESPDSRRDSGRPRSLTPLHRADRGDRPALLPIDRGQGDAVRG